MRILLLSCLILLPATAQSQTEGEPGTSPSETAAKAPPQPAHSPAPDKDARPTESAADTPDDAQEPPALTKMPKLKTFVEADYPEAAMAEGIEAEVTLEIDIDAEGKVEAATVIIPAEPAGYGFDEAAMLAVQKFEFEPAYVGEEPIPVRITYKYRFVLATPEPAPDAPEPEREPVVTFKGELLERGTRLPLAGVLVTVFREDESGETVGFEALTEVDGSFVFYDLTPGTWKVLVDPQGYYPVRTSEDVVEGEVTEVKYFVERGSYNPFDIMVVAKRVRKEVSRTTLSIEEADKVPGTFGDVLKVVENLPGVARGGFFQPGFAVRGSAPEDTRILLDGTEVPLIYHFGGLRTVIPNGMIGSVDFYPGNFPTAFSRATGGVLDVGLKQLRPEAFGGYADVNLYDSSVYLEIPLGDRGAIAIGGRRSYIDLPLEPIVSGLADEKNLRSIALPRYWDTQLLATYRPTDAHEVQAFFMYSDDAFKVLFGDEEDELEFSLKMRFYRAILEYSFIPSETLQNSLRISQGHNWNDFRFGNDFRADDDFDMLQVRDTLQWQLWDWGTLVSGADYMWTSTDSRIILPPDTIADDAHESSDIVDADYHALGLFADIELTPVDGLLVIPGLRFDHFQRVGSTVAAPRLTTRYSLNEQWVVKGSAGVFYQEPTVAETSEVRGNPNLDVEKALHFSLGAEFRPLEYLTLDVTGFYKDLSNLVMPSEEVVERNGEAVPERVANTGEGHVYGLEVLFRHEFANNFFGWLSYTLSVSKRRERAGEPLYLFEYDQTHILTLVGSYQLPRNWEISLRWRLISGNPTTPVIGTVVDADNDNYAPIMDGRNQGRLPPFHQLDVRLDKRWVYDNWTLSVYLDMQNVYDRSNPELIAYNYNYTDQAYSGGVPILGILGVKGEF